MALVLFHLVALSPIFVGCGGQRQTSAPGSRVSADEKQTLIPNSRRASRNSVRGNVPNVVVKAKLRGGTPSLSVRRLSLWSVLSAAEVVFPNDEIASRGCEAVWICEHIMRCRVSYPVVARNRV
jgi:hypothetical protein